MDTTTAGRPPKRGAVDRLRAIAKGWARRMRRRRAVGRRAGGRRLAVALVLFLLVLLASFGAALAYLRPSSDGRQLALDELSALADQRRIATVTFKDEDARVEGTFTASPRSGPTQAAAAAPDGSGAFWVAYPKSDAATTLLFQLFADAGARIEVDPQTGKAQVRLVATFLLPLMILADLFALLFAAGRGGASGIGDIITFGSIGQKRMRRGELAPVTFADIAGADEAVDELKEVRDYLANPERYSEIGALPPKGVLLVGPPGCGKTLMAKAVAGEVGVPFFSVAGAEFVESLVGIGAARVRDLFRRVRAAAPAIVFIDELDAAGRKRAHGGGAGGADEREQTLNQLLVEMDGFEVSSGIVVIGATNRPDILDPALLRPGRFDRHITIDRPDIVGRERILQLHARARPFAGPVDFSYIARRTPGFSGADLANVINESALLAVRQGRAGIATADLEAAIHRVMTGTSRRGRMLSVEERRRAAYHEGGHAIAAAATGRLGELHRVSVLGWGLSVGTAALLRETDSAVLTRGQLAGRLVTLLAGVAAEEAVFSEPSTGAEQDLQQATDLARDMVTRYGMSRRLGRARLQARELDGFLDADVPLAPVSEQTHQEIDAEIKALLEEAEKEATRLIRAHRRTLNALAETLGREETLEGEHLHAALAGVAGLRAAGAPAPPRRIVAAAKRPPASRTPGPVTRRSSSGGRSGGTRRR